MNFSTSPIEISAVTASALLVAFIGLLATLRRGHWLTTLLFSSAFLAVAAFEAGKTDEALKWHRRLFTLCRDLLSVATNPISVKTALKLLGRDTGELRLPLCSLDAAGESRIRQTLRSYGLPA